MVQAFGRAVRAPMWAVFYFAGHGVQVKGGTIWSRSAPIRPARPMSVSSCSIPDLVLSQMDGAGTKLNLVILDACRNNPFGGRGLRSTGTASRRSRAPGHADLLATQPGSVRSTARTATAPTPRRWRRR